MGWEEALGSTGSTEGGAGMGRAEAAISGDKAGAAVSGDKDERDGLGCNVMGRFGLGEVVEVCEGIGPKIEGKRESVRGRELGPMGCVCEGEGQPVGWAETDPNRDGN